jgi:hypothetical protein
MFLLIAQSRYRNITMDLPKIDFNLYNIGSQSVRRGSLVRRDVCIRAPRRHEILSGLTFSLSLVIL